MTPEQIIEEAVKKYNPVKIVLLFSGGHDSLVSSHISSLILKKMGFDFIVYHGDTTIGIPQTQDYVKKVCLEYGWPLEIRKPPSKKLYYENMVKKYGFPGPGQMSHKVMYRNLKEKALSKFVTHECKNSPFSRENVMLISGVRQSESIIRMGYKEHTQKDDSKIWVSPIFYYSNKDCEKYMTLNQLPRNEVKDKICISGECLCGVYSSFEEYSEIKEAYPDTYKRLTELHEEAKKNGHDWPWYSGPSEWYKNHPKGTMDMFLCLGCEEKYKP